MRPPPAPGTFQVGTIAGWDVLVTTSWFLIAALIAWTVAPRVDQVEPGLGGLQVRRRVRASRSCSTSRCCSTRPRTPTWPSTTASRSPRSPCTSSAAPPQIEGEARTPRQEFLIAVVGPLTSLAVGGAALGLWFVTPDGLLLLAVEGLAGANLLVGVLNLVPGLPLDGGRVLKAAVWRVTGDKLRGTIVAAWAGRMTAVAALAWPLVQEPLFGTPPDIFDFVLAGVIALFLWTGPARRSTSAQARQPAARPGRARLARRTLTVPDDLPLAEAVRRAQEAEAGSLSPSPAPGRRSAWSTRPPWSRRPRTAAPGSRSPPWRAPWSRAAACRPTSRARSWSGR